MNRGDTIMTTRNMTFPRIEGEFFRVIQPLTKNQRYDVYRRTKGKWTL